MKNREGYITTSIGKAIEEELYEAKVAGAIGVGIEVMR